VFYSGSRLALVTYLVSIAINLFDREALGCNAQTWIMRITTSIVICFSGVLLSLRVISSWPRFEQIVSPIGVLLAVLVVINCLTWQTPDKVWDSVLSRCVARAAVHKAITMAQFLYTFLFFLSLNILYARRYFPRRGLKNIMKVFAEEGVWTFSLLVVVYLAQAVITCIWVDDIVIVLFVPVALAITVIAVSRTYVIRYGEKTEQTDIPTTTRRVPGRPPPSTSPFPSSWRKSSTMATASTSRG
ncbi:hypothetical protein FS842_001539, partial [Serendipita sp. 407]